MNESRVPSPKGTVASQVRSGQAATPAKDLFADRRLPGRHADDRLDTLAREGARRMIEIALEAEVEVAMTLYALVTGIRRVSVNTTASNIARGFGNGSGKADS